MKWKSSKRKLLVFFNPKRLIKKIWEDEFKISLFVLLIAFLAVNLPTILSGRYLQREFLENMLANANSMVLDILVILCLTTYLIKKSEKRREIQRLKDEIDDYRRWKSEESTYRILGIVNRLQKLHVKDINLSCCYFNSANLADIDFHGIYLINASMEGTKLIAANLQKANLARANLCRANIQAADLTGAYLKYADLSNAKLNGAILADADFDEATIYEANFSGSDLNKIKNLTKAIGLESAKFIRAIMDDETREYLSKINPTVKPLEKTQKQLDFMQEIITFKKTTR